MKLDDTQQAIRRFELEQNEIEEEDDDDDDGNHEGLKLLIQ